MTPRNDKIMMHAEAAGEASEAVPSAAVQHLLQEDETVLLFLRPSPWFVLLDGGSIYLLIAVCALFFAWLGNQPWTPVVFSEQQVFSAFAMVVVLRAIWKTLDWANRLYVLTDRRILRRRGVFVMSVVEAPLRRIQNSAVYARVRERVLGLGTIGFATAGSDGFEVVWEIIPSPIDVHRTVLDAIERYGRGPGL
jgi:membrane protein YdbS with pleckstrin-like domain